MDVLTTQPHGLAAAQARAAQQQHQQPVTAERHVCRLAIVRGFTDVGYVRRASSASRRASASGSASGRPAFANQMATFLASRSRKVRPFGWEMTSTTCGRSIITSRPWWTSRLYGDRSEERRVGKEC